MADDPTEPKEHPLAPLTRIRQRISEQAGERGLKLHGLAVVPAKDPDGPHQAQVVLVLDDDKPDVVIVRGGTGDREFDELMEGSAKAADEERAKAAREDLEHLREQLKDPNKGFLD